MTISEDWIVQRANENELKFVLCTISQCPYFFTRLGNIFGFRLNFRDNEYGAVGKGTGLRVYVCTGSTTN